MLSDFLEKLSFYRRPNRRLKNMMTDCNLNEVVDAPRVGVRLSEDETNTFWSFDCIDVVRCEVHVRGERLFWVPFNRDVVP